jgi:membrane protease YdiL (CAAX protease family)
LVRLRRPLSEVLAVFAFIMLYIWRLRASHPWCWMFALAAILLSHYFRGERPSDIGIRSRGFLVCLRRYGPAMAAIVALGIGCALEWGTLRPMTARGAALSLGLYLPWGLFQQYLLNGYLLNRLEAALSPLKSAGLASCLFALAHLPNWFLMLTTLGFGLCANLIYRRHKNLYFLGLAHGLLGFTIFVAAPDWLIHHLRVGPGWFR